MKSLVGFTGFVGSNIAAKGNFDGLYNTKNIESAYGTNPELLIYAGIRAEKFYANNDPKKDFENIVVAFDNIKKIQPKKLVLISTIDVYKDPNQVDENTDIELDGLEPYGYNRYQLECMVRKEYPNALIIRLPGLYGKNIKKNFIYDAIHIIPSLLKVEKYEELTKKSSLIAASYIQQDEKFYKCKVAKENIAALKEEFLKVGFSALNFTDSRGNFQFYNLSNLWEHIQIALENNIKLLNLATEPVNIGELYSYIFGDPFVNEISKHVPNYNYKTIHDKVFKGSTGYLIDKDKVLQDIKQFVEGEI